jgi:hypothetical protein
MLTAVPAKWSAGDSWEFRKEFTDYPAGVWTLAYFFKSAAAEFSISGAEVAEDGVAFVLTKAAAATAAIVPGVYAFKAYASASIFRREVDSGSLEVLRNFAAAGVYDARTNARKALDAVEAYMADPNNLTAASYQIGSRSLNRFQPGELLKVRSRLMADVAREEAAAAGRRVGREFLRFR